MAIDYVGDDIAIEEMPQGCIIANKQGKFVIIASISDALAVIESLERMIEIQQGFHDGTIPSCPLCGNNMSKVFSPTPVHFRGTGFYKTGG